MLIRVVDGTGSCGVHKNFELKHRFLYKQHYGNIKKGYAVIFKDGNKFNLEIDNLIAIKRSELLYLNQKGYTKLSGELFDVALGVAKLKTKCSEIKGERNDTRRI